MDKVVGIKRKAQRFVQEGDLTRALAEYERLLELGELDPYDYVYLGDLLVRTGDSEQAVYRYREAVTAYERVGLYKNAIAVGKKILRIRPETFDVHRMLGGLYFLEGLYTDALFFYMQFLSGPSADAPAVEEVGLRLLGMPLPSADVAIKVVDAMETAGCAASAALPLYDLASDYRSRSQVEDADRLEQRALRIDPEVARRRPLPEEEALPEDESYAPPFDAHGLEAGYAAASGSGGPGSGAPSAAGAASMAEFGMIDLPGASDSSVEPDQVTGFEADGGESPVASAGDIGRAAPFDGGPAITSLLDDDASSASPVAEGEPAAGATDAEGDEEPDVEGLNSREILIRAEESRQAGNTGQAMRLFLAAARCAFKSGESRLAETIYTDMVHLDPNHLEALRGLTEIAHINGERAKIVRHGCELGDVLLAREAYLEAKLEFERVLQFDPRNEKARSRVARLNSIEGVGKVKARPLAPMASEVRGATVSVRGEESKRTQSVMDLSAIMAEFQSAINGQLSPDDAQGHYDLGMAYLEMKMTDQALTEFGMAREAETHRGAALEMMARCYLAAGRPGEALAAVEEAAGIEGDDSARQAALFAYRGLALEALGRIPEATHALERALSLEPGLTLAREAMQRLGISDAGEAAA